MGCLIFCHGCHHSRQRPRKWTRVAMEMTQSEVEELDLALDAILDVLTTEVQCISSDSTSTSHPPSVFPESATSSATAPNSCLEGLSSRDSCHFHEALHTIFQAFTEDADDAQLRQAEETYSRLSAQEQRIAKKTKIFHVYPTVVHNDFRRCFPQMYMNTLNSGDFEKVQDYYHTFMKASTKFVADHTHVSDLFGIPNWIEMYGPNLAIHYILGSSLMYPDLVMKTHGTRVTTSNSWRGTRIEMDVEFQSTKMNHLPIEEWLPQASILEARYQDIEIEKMKNLCGVNGHGAASPTMVDGADFVSIAVSTQKKRRVDHCDGASVVTGNSVSSSQYYARQPRIPVEYVHALCTKVALLPAPLQLHTKGRITIFLDENNYMQLINLTVRQV